MLKEVPRFLVLIRGLPGSGKSTMAKAFVEGGYKHYEADQYFRVNGEYKFKPEELPNAHDDCYRNVLQAMNNGEDVVVSNTFSRYWEIAQYIKLAEMRGYEVRIIKANGNWPNIHEVPDSVIAKMKSRWEDIPGETIYTPKENDNER